MDNPVSHEIFRLKTVSVRLNRDAPVYSRHRIQNPQDVVDFVGELLCKVRQKVVCIINLNADGTPIGCYFASVGANNYAVTHPSELLKAGILSNAAGMVLVHYHPYGNLQPSTADVQLTDWMIKLADMVGIPFLDHVIAGRDRHCFFSFRENGMMKNTMQKKEMPKFRYKSKWKKLIQINDFFHCVKKSVPRFMMYNLTFALEIITSTGLLVLPETTGLIAFHVMLFAAAVPFILIFCYEIFSPFFRSFYNCKI